MKKNLSFNSAATSVLPMLLPYVCWGLTVMQYTDWQRQRESNCMHSWISTSDMLGLQLMLYFSASCLFKRLLNTQPEPEHRPGLLVFKLWWLFEINSGQLLPWFSVFTCHHMALKWFGSSSMQGWHINKIKMDETLPLPPIVEMWSQHIQDRSVAILNWWEHFQSEHCAVAQKRSLVPPVK